MYVALYCALDQFSFFQKLSLQKLLYRYTAGTKMVPDLFQIELHAEVRGFESEPFVKAVCVRAGLMRGELH